MFLLRASQNPQIVRGLSMTRVAQGGAPDVPAETP